MKKKKKIYDNIDGFRLEVPKVWPQLSREERDKICNGVGPESWSPSLRAIVGKITGFGPASKPHDVEYRYGCTEKDRKEADKRFFRNCRTIIRKEMHWPYLWLIPAWRELYILRLAEAEEAYDLLRRLGASAFWSGKDCIEQNDGTKERQKNA